MKLFHGGCHRCTMQDEKGIGYCTGCMFFDANETLPDLNDAHARENIAREVLKQKAREAAKLIL